MSRVVFVTGTDTGAGKTVLTGLLLAHLRRRGVRALAMKPVESGGRADARLLCALQERELGLDEVNPFWFREPLAPAVAARRCGASVLKKDILKAAGRLKSRCDVLLVEGAGGLLSPMGKNWSGLDLALGLRAKTLLAAGNVLGAINHARLTLDRLRWEKIESAGMVLMGGGRSVLCRENASELREKTVKVPIFEIGNSADLKRGVSGILRAEKKFSKTLAKVVSCL
ncbi:MAG: dethiobiotin synthase [Verrucomicrobiales bacterium]|nr:dethiobiotin synthase [Verrucomicrobiales bacterium]|tara:strand:- start:614 stop:1294 length:681 start_codon:yes stop_codon:yes gene_type:complete